MSLVSINWTPNAKELRQFGVVMLVGFGLIGAVFYFGWIPWTWGEAHPKAATVCWIVAAVAGALGLTGTKAALPVYWAWMGIAFVMGHIMSRVILALFFYGMITPMGWIMRATGRDKLHLARTGADTYWRDIDQPTDKARYERQF